jgi:predicted transcriptional regulator
MSTTNLEEVVFRKIKEARVGLTLDDLVAATGLDKVTVSPRLKPLEAKGLIVRDGKRAGLSNRKQTIWKKA